MEIQNEASKYFVGENLDVFDKKRWLNGEVLGIQKNKLFIHYTGWHPKFDQFVPVSSGRILKQWEPKKSISLNNRLDVYHPIGGWLQARVYQLGQITQNGQIHKARVHFFNFHPKYDMWVDLNDKNQVTIIGQKSKAYGMGKRKRNLNNKRLLSELSREILRQKLLKMIRQLSQNNLEMKEVGGDGNCLFRAISDQLYGQETFHNQIRQICMKYILHEKQFFQNFLVQDIQQYVQRKSKDGVWGDDIEIEAISQIYGRPIQIYAMGIKPIRTFHEDNEHNIEPLKIAYIGSCHYNSIKTKNDLNSRLIQSSYGQSQKVFFETYLNNKNSQAYWIDKNRDKFSHFNPLQLTIQQRIQAQSQNKHEPEQFQKDLMQQAIQISQNQQISKQIEAAQLKQLQKKLEQQALQKQLKRLEEQEIQQAKKLSAMNTHMPEKKQIPYWFQDIYQMGFTEDQIWFAIEIKGYDPEGVQNFLLDNM